MALCTILAKLVKKFFKKTSGVVVVLQISFLVQAVI
jgi:hypothetical protein